MVTGEGSAHDMLNDEGEMCKTCSITGLWEAAKFIIMKLSI